MNAYKNVEMTDTHLPMRVRLRLSSCTADYFPFVVFVIKKTCAVFINVFWNRHIATKWSTGKTKYNNNGRIGRKPAKYGRDRSRYFNQKNGK